MKRRSTAPAPKKKPATVTGTGGAIHPIIQLTLDGVEPLPSKTACYCLLAGEDPLVIRFGKMLLTRQQGVECAAARLLGIGTHLPNQAKRLRDVYGVHIDNLPVHPSSKAEKYVLPTWQREQLAQLLAGA